MGKHIKYGVVGVGHLGSFHVQQLKKLARVVLLGVFDVNPSAANKTALKYDVKKCYYYV